MDLCCHKTLTNGPPKTSTQMLNHRLVSCHLSWFNDIDNILSDKQKKIHRLSGIRLEGCGSYFEGTCRPNIQRKIDIDSDIDLYTNKLPYPDVDLMFIHESYKIAEKGNAKKMLSAFVAEPGSGPCFVKLMINRSVFASLNNRDHCLMLNELSTKMGKKTYLSNDIGAFTSKFLVRKGPSLRLCMKDVGHIMMYDHVHVIPFAHWPSVASNWLKRVRQSKWPTADIIEKVVKIGCHVVAKPSVCKPNDIEWRLSFSLGEKLLMRSITQIQNKCLVVAKLIIKCILSNPDDVSSFFVKTVIMWQMERKGQTNWTIDSAPCDILGIINELIEAYEKGVLKHYFIPNHNLLGSNERRYHTVNTVKQLKEIAKCAKHVIDNHRLNTCLVLDVDELLPKVYEAWHSLERNKQMIAICPQTRSTSAHLMVEDLTKETKIVTTIKEVAMLNLLTENPDNVHSQTTRFLTKTLEICNILPDLVELVRGVTK